MAGPAQGDADTYCMIDEILTLNVARMILMTFSFTDSFRMSAIVGIKLNLKRTRQVMVRE